MSMREIRAEPLTSAAFAPFGEVIAADDTAHYPINYGTAERYDLATIEIADDARPRISIVRGQPFTPPVTAWELERHPRASQAFVPLEGRPYLVVVAPPGDTVDPAAVRAFHAWGDQGVNYRTGVWHHGLIALQDVSDFLVIDRAGEDNCDTCALAEPVRVYAPSAGRGRRPASG